MRTCANGWSERFAAIASLALTLLVIYGSAAAAPQQSPVLFSVSATSTRAVALESVSMRAEPFSLSSEANFSPNDPRTRIELFCMNLYLLDGTDENVLTARAVYEDMN